MERNIKNLKILIVDDDKEVTDFICKALNFLKFKHLTYLHTGKEAIKLLKEKKFDLIFLDVLLPDINGKKILSHIRNNYPDLTVIIITGHDDINKNEIIKSGARAVLLKPFLIEDIIDTLDNVTN